MGILRYNILILLSLSISAFAQLSPGDLAEPHKHLEGLTNCTNCHELGEGPSAAKCLECHQTLKKQIETEKGLHYIYTKIEQKVCFSCHNDHAGREFQLIRWEPSIEKFDHSQTGYILSGKHADQQCRECHNPALIHTDLKSIEKDIDLTKTFLGLDTNCLSCHHDEHRNQLGDNCTTCHNQNGWKNTVHFDHNKANFKLTGKHTNVDCLKCHPMLIDNHPVIARDTTFMKFINLKYDNCTSCHKDIHKNKFGQDCIRCHVTDGWKILDERNIDHNKTNFPLKGKHADVKCDKCHKPGVRFAKNQYDECKDCHLDYHVGQFVTRKDKGACESCHTVSGYKPTLFTIASHNKSEFPLEGAHLAQPCFVCHEYIESNVEKKVRNFKPKKRECAECHKDIHLGQFANASPSKTCTDCHNVEDWKHLKFDHTRDSSYPLKGAHQKVSCAGCHQPELNGTETIVRYKPLDTKCESCHISSVKPL
ncbi:MAG: cytochrome C [Calditrichaeota bacterium]|nr:MAG: cytochrome C [Calditrichota bacterium]